ncbi:MAG: elongation factor 1-beta [Candidatus Woesearchaeota archaeon]
MAHVIVGIKIMPEGPEKDLQKIEEEAKEKIVQFGGTVQKTETQPVAFGLNSVNITFSMDENLGDTEQLEQDISEVQDVNSVQVESVSRALG